MEIFRDLFGKFYRIFIYFLIYIGVRVMSVYLLMQPKPTSDWLHSGVGRLQYRTVQYNTVEYSTVEYSKVHYSTVQYSTAKYITVQQCMLSENNFSFFINYSAFFIFFKQFCDLYLCGQNMWACLFNGEKVWSNLFNGNGLRGN